MKKKPKKTPFSQFFYEFNSIIIDKYLFILAIEL